jgi:hypothetical protein
MIIMHAATGVVQDEIWSYIEWGSGGSGDDFIPVDPRLSPFSFWFFFDFLCTC